MHFPGAVVATVLAAGQLITLVYGHVEMKNPLPFRSTFIVPQPANADFSMTSPLNADGSNFPCKGYQNDSLAPTATLVAGSSFALELYGSATHNGGSCQLSLSYDGGQNFVVIYSIVGGCPLDSENYTIPVPSDVPNSSKAILAWSWENNTGDREYYMNCAPVEITGSTSEAFTGPRMYEANVMSAPNCVTPENYDVVYPNPGKYLQFGGKYVGGNTGPDTVLTPCNFNENEMLTVTGDGQASVSAGSANSNTTASDPSTASNSTSSSDPAPSADAASSSSSSDPAAATAADAVPAATGLTTSTTVITSTGTTTIIVTPTDGVVTVTTNIDTGATAPAPVATAAADPPVGSNTTTTTSSGDGTAGAACSNNGAITCGAGGQTWYMCDNGALVDMGSVAAGTTCSNGQITRKRGLPPQIFGRHRIRAFGGWGA